MLHECSSATVSDGLWNASRARTSSASCRVTGRLARLRLVAHRPVRIALSRRMNRREATNSPSLKICDSQPTPPPWNRSAEALARRAGDASGRARGRRLDAGSVSSVIKHQKRAARRRSFDRLIQVITIAFVISDDVAEATA